jgi:hypothetical protein
MRVAVGVVPNVRERETHRRFFVGKQIGYAINKVFVVSNHNSIMQHKKKKVKAFYRLFQKKDTVLKHCSKIYVEKGGILVLQ